MLGWGSKNSAKPLNIRDMKIGDLKRRYQLTTKDMWPFIVNECETVLLDLVF